jgi:hypothetical protein
MHRGRLLGLFASTLIGCAAGENPILFGADTGTGRIDTGSSLEEDTGSLEEDTGSLEEDTGSAKKDSGTKLDTGTATIDSGTSVDSTSIDSSLPDTVIIADAGEDTTVGDTMPSETGGGTTRIRAGSSLVLHGVTSDDFAIVSEATGATWAVPLAGGTAQSVGTGTTLALVSGNVAFAWGSADLYGFAPLRVWSASTGSKSVATKSLRPSTTNAAATRVAAASKDGAYIFFTDGGTGGTSQRADLKVAKTDGTSVRTVFTQYAVYDGSLTGYEDYCAPYVAWVGTRFVTTHCSPGVSFDASSIDPATGTPTSLGTNLGAYWTSDDAGTKVALVSSGALRVIAPTGGGSTLIDTGVASGVFTHDGTAIVYRTSANALKRSPTTSSSPTTLVTSGAIAILTAPSPNDQWILYAGTGSSGAYDIRRASTTTAGSTTLHASANADVYGVGFTSDSAYAIYYTAVSTIGVGNLVAYPMAGGTATTLGTGAWFDFAVGGSKLVYNDNHVGSASSGTATIRARDVAGSTSTTIAASADRNFGISAARDKVVYVIPTDGLWVAPVP